MKKATKLCAPDGALRLAFGLDNRPVLRRYSLIQPHLPAAFDGLKIVHISDLHGEIVPGLAERIGLEKPDLIAVTGDLMHDTGDFSPMVRQLAALSEIAPCYLISGNHDIQRTDYLALTKACHSAGCIFLENERRYLVRGESRIALSGIADPQLCGKNGIQKQLVEHCAVLGTPDTYEILLFHRASLFPVLQERGYDLILAGHMHGGQIRLPGIGGVLAPRSSLHEHTRLLFPKYTGGLYTAGKTSMIVSRGLGNPLPLPRFGNPREIGVITLKSEEKL